MRREPSFGEECGYLYGVFWGFTVHMIGARASPGCELCKSARKMDWRTFKVPVVNRRRRVLLELTTAAGSILSAPDVSTHGEAKRILEFIGGDKDRQLKHDDDPFIVLTETKFSFRCIPVWIGTLLTGLGPKKKHM